MRMIGIRVGSSSECSNCGCSCEVDFNEEMNMPKRGSGYVPNLGADLTQPGRYDERDDSRKTQNLLISIAETVN